MNQDQPGVRHGDLLRITEALRNEKALFVLLVTGLLTGALAFMGSMLATPGSSFVTAALLIFVALLVLPVGGSAAGLLLMDQARGQAPRELYKAVIDGIFAALRIFTVSLVGIAVVAVFYVLLILLLLLCKMPAAGPVLHAVLFPALVVLAGLLLFGLYVALSMAGPAIWSGATIGDALAMLWRIATSRIAELLVSLFLLILLIGLAECVIGGILLAGYYIVLNASASILGGSPLEAISLTVFSDNSPHALAVKFGTMIVLVLVSALLLAMTMMGLNLIYLRVSEDPATRRARSLAQAPDYWRKIEPTIQASAEPSFPPAATDGSGNVPDMLAPIVATAAASEPAPPAPEPAFTPEPAPAAQPLTCPYCQAALQPGDRFCGECGGKVPD
ncbi:MAG: zinc ribbon domain-containing protein [Azoarcus sp.]|jgi:hypothetical protein|nr:zinc ribbon domain-containing protein [Azoarcus sp.]